MDSGGITRRLENILNTMHSSEASFAERKKAAIDSLRIVRERPWIGAGLGSFETVFPRYRSFPTDQQWDHAHNDYAEALAETGVVGGLLILVALVSFFRVAFRNLRERLQTDVGWIQFGAALGCCGLLVHSLADFNLHIPANAAWFAVSAGLACHPGVPLEATSGPAKTEGASGFDFPRTQTSRVAREGW
jgi:O-antigen ligase